MKRPAAAQATREDLGVVVSLSREGDDVDDASFVVEAAHSPHGLSQGRVSQKTAVPLRRTAFCYGEWHHFYVEGRGRTRLSLFGRDELSAWIDGEEILSRCSFLFPTAISSPGYEPAAARDGFGYGYYGAPKAPQAAHELDDCAFGRGLDGQLGAVYVLSECVTASQRDSLSCRYSERGFRARLVAETLRRMQRYFVGSSHDCEWHLPGDPSAGLRHRGIPIPQGRNLGHCGRHGEKGYCRTRRRTRL